MVNFKHSDFNNAGAAIDDILADKITGVVWNNALSKTECSEIITIIEQLKEQYHTDLNDENGYSLPSMFGQLHQSLPYEMTTKYFADVNSFLAAVNSVCQQDFYLKIKALLQKAFQPFAISSLNGFLPYSFRVVYPGKGALSLHRDRDLLPYIHSDVANKISSAIKPETLMSWFFTIQQPEAGGELWVADNAYNNYRKMDEKLINENGIAVSPQEITYLTLPTQSGSLLLFKGGSYWHRVLPPTGGSRERITLGGFMALSVEGDSIVFWS